MIASVNTWQTALASMEQGVWQWRIKKENGTKLWANRSTYYYGDNSVYQLGPLLQYDNKIHLEYLKTLELILESNNLRETAKNAYVHYKTMQMRKKRIRKLLVFHLMI